VRSTWHAKAPDRFCINPELPVIPSEACASFATKREARNTFLAFACAPVIPSEACGSSATKREPRNPFHALPTPSACSGGRKTMHRRGSTRLQPGENRPISKPGFSPCVSGQPVISGGAAFNAALKPSKSLSFRAEESLSCFCGPVALCRSPIHNWGFNLCSGASSLDRRRHVLTIEDDCCHDPEEQRLRDRYRHEHPAACPPGPVLKTHEVARHMGDREQH
jgi:hypothetical protein